MDMWGIFNGHANEMDKKYTQSGPGQNQGHTSSNELKAHSQWANRCEKGPLAFCEAVRSSAKLVARFLAHWLSCMAAAWSLTVGTAALAEDTILLPGCREVSRK